MNAVLKANPSAQDVLDVCTNMRARDAEEIFATRYGGPEQLARDTMHVGDFKWCAYVDNAPVALIGAVPRWPRVWSAWAFGTDQWPAASGLLTRHVRRFMLPALYNAGALRVDAMTLSTHTDARRWLEFLGAEPKETMDNWGKNGETFVCYVWTRKQTKRLIDHPGRKIRTR